MRKLHIPKKLNISKSKTIEIHNRKSQKGKCRKPCQRHVPGDTGTSRQEGQHLEDKENPDSRHKGSSDRRVGEGRCTETLLQINRVFRTIAGKTRKGPVVDTHFRKQRRRSC